MCTIGQPLYIFFFDAPGAYPVCNFYADLFSWQSSKLEIVFLLGFFRQKIAFKSQTMNGNDDF